MKNSLVSTTVDLKVINGELSLYFLKSTKQLADLAFSATHLQSLFFFNLSFLCKKNDMDSYGLSYGIVWSEDVFKKFAATYHILLQATLFFLLVILLREGKPEIIDLASFQIWKVSFRSMMGLFAATNASTYLTFRNLYAYYEASSTSPSFYTPSSRFRIFEEMSIFFGILTLLLLRLSFLVWNWQSTLHSDLEASTHLKVICTVTDLVCSQSWSLVTPMEWLFFLRVQHGIGITKLCLIMTSSPSQLYIFSAACVI
ncbi:Uncharacterized protein Rs2_52681 [Raphanus sativus]|nr:Uncharacterized protein Rs2_52681 [Raphanus sativus]